MKQSALAACIPVTPSSRPPRLDKPPRIRASRRPRRLCHPPRPASTQASKNKLLLDHLRIQCRGTFCRGSLTATSSTRTPFSPSPTSRTSSSVLESLRVPESLRQPQYRALHPSELTPVLRSRYADHVGIHYVLCNKLRQFPYEDVEFFLPELCHLIISVNNESMALEEFLLDLCEESVSGALLVSVFAPVRALASSANSYIGLLAVPELSDRPLLQSALRGFQNMSKGLQQGPAHSVWAGRHC